MDECLAEPLIPVFKEHGGRLEGVLGGEIFRVFLGFANEAQSTEDSGVLKWGLPKHFDDTISWEVLRCEDRHDGGLTSAISPQQTVDAVGFEGEGDVVKCDIISVLFR